MQHINIQKTQGGFTLIELVIVIVILGILAAVAVPRFVDLSVEAGNAAAQGVAASVTSGSAINFAACKAGNPDCTTIDATTDCTALVGLLEENALPTDVSWDADAGPVSATGDGCALSHDDGDTSYTVRAYLTD